MPLAPVCQNPVVNGSVVECSSWSFVQADDMAAWDFSLIDPAVFGQSFAAGFTTIAVFWLVGVTVAKLLQLIRH